MTSRRLFQGGALAIACLLAVVSAHQSGTAQDGKRPQPKAKAKPAVNPIAQLGGFSDWVTSIEFSPNGNKLAAGTFDAVKVFDAKTRKLEKTLKAKGFVKAVSFSRDGKLLAAGGYQGATLWETDGFSAVRQLKGHRGYVTGVAFSPDGKRLVTSSEDESIRIWNTESGKEELAIRGHSYPVMDVVFSPDGKLIASVAGDETRVTKPGEVKIWDAATGEEKLNLVEHEKAATSVAFSRDGKYLASTGEDEKVNLYEVATGKALGYYNGHARPTNDVLFTGEGEIVISAAGGRAKGKHDVKVWERAGGDERATLSGHKGQVACVALSPDGKTLVSGGYDKAVLLWDISKVLAKPAAEAVAIADVIAVEAPEPKAEPATKVIRAGIIGLDTSHVLAFTKLLNDEKADADIANCRVVAAYPKGSPDIVSSTSRVPKYTEQMKEMGVEIVDSIEAMLEKVDVVLLETNDGRPHFDQLLPVLKAGKPVFIDKPIAGSLTDAVAIFEAGKKYNVPLFSSSSLRFSEGAQALRNGSAGDILGCDAYSPCSLEATHPDLFWYGIHGVETLFTVMGAGCKTVTRSSTPDLDVVVGTWDGGRIGTFRGIRKGKGGYGGTAFGTKGIVPVGSYGGYRPLLVEIVKFFRTGIVPVAEQETLEIYAFMEAADESKRRKGVPVTLQEVLTKARKEAADKLAKLK
ncbi:MAG: Gfo/Idh/MocA family oxidoreductase [Planctomycetaceae bacterium]|jgi:predicted dehydrogenase/Tol biopolymer transport system component|nr:Gfo/Idh/MocA family oxidoreductase [Planctomycetaceae bacterium]MBT6157870.1 Gfo/Idh/MocA family oxidoreductase [Planctomycetaceae bacterium]MBT6487060.1 Gfo/Idh/MocA family oxidoreductase [Planctomycetaceae bacterium]MBT6493272.1 Gfo/Idh/MocA family oxidoreductase [Planctomycetaceae bacterium]